MLLFLVTTSTIYKNIFIDLKIIVFLKTFFVEKCIGIGLTQMGEEGEGCGIFLGIVGVVALGIGLYFLISGTIAYTHDYPEEYKGLLNPYEQTYVCPGNRSRDKNVNYKGGMNLVATLTEGLSDVSHSFNKSVFKKRETIGSEQHLFIPFYLIQGSTVKWTIDATGPISFFFYKEPSILCSGLTCGPLWWSTGLLAFSDSYKVGIDGLYYVEIINGEDIFRVLDYLFEVFHTRYNIEEVQIEQAIGNKTFSLPTKENQTSGCVFVEYPHKAGSSQYFSLSYHLGEKDKRSKLITSIVLGCILAVIGIALLIAGIVLCCCDS